ncbi:hypothetical protein [Ralstonia syzygii]|uniref:hypothetical protein n=1 Tax=Ralstonia syzygii TaxID=28097 RepID=UPI0036F1B150
MFRLPLKDARPMPLIGTTGSLKGAGRHRAVHCRRIAPAGRTCLLYWHEPHTGINVVHVEDLEAVSPTPTSPCRTAARSI